jgi:predicted glycogen debranching enzyme
MAMNGLDATALPFDGLIGREWLAVNGLGGFACSTLPGLNTRKYHGLLVAAMAPPVRQMVLLSRVEDFVHRDGKAYGLANSEYPGTVHPLGYQFLRAFSTDPFPRWAYQGEEWTVEKQLRLLQGENTVLISYTLLGGNRPIDLELKPLFALRGIHDLMYQWNGLLEVETTGRGHHRIPATTRTPEVFFAHEGKFTPSACWYFNSIYRREQERGYAGLEDLWNPGSIRWTLSPGQTVHFVCSTDPIDLERTTGLAHRQSLGHPKPTVAERVPDTVLDALVRAAEQFVVQNAEQTVRIMPGYPWAAPSGRDGMISLPGLLLVTGKLAEARSMLQFFASLVNEGLMPSEFPIDGSAPRYESADASLWFINAVRQYQRYGGDEAFVLRNLWPVIDEVLRRYQQGTGLGIVADAEGLLSSQQPGVPTSWMDARVLEWVVTPRAGATVELNALWYNALCIGSELARAAGMTQRAEELAQLAGTQKAAFNRRFWSDATHCCADVVTAGGADASIRPNQLLALSLPHPVLNLDRHASVLKVVRDHLLTPFGLRTLSPEHPLYVGVYGGALISRDKALHQGSAYPWLLGPFVTAFVRTFGRSPTVRQEAGKMLQGCIAYLRGDDTRQLCDGQLCELFDGNAPHAPGGLIASARSVAEVLRCYVEDVLDLGPAAALPRGNAVANVYRTGGVESETSGAATDL